MGRGGRSGGGRWGWKDNLGLKRPFYVMLRRWVLVEGDGSYCGILCTRITFSHLCFLLGVGRMGERGKE